MAVVTGVRTLPVLDQLAADVVGWERGVGETTAPLLGAATTKKPRVTDLVFGTARTGLSITRREQGIAARPAARAQSMKKYPRGGGSEVRKRAVRVGAVTSVTLTRKNTRNPTPRTVQGTPEPQGMSLQWHPEFLRLACSPPGGFPLEGAGVEAAEGETCTGAVAPLEGLLGVTGSDLAQVLTPGQQSLPLQAGNSKVHL